MSIESAEKVKVEIRPMEPEDINAILEIDRKISGVTRAVTYADLIAGDLGGELESSLVALVDDSVVGFILARHVYLGYPVIKVALIQTVGVDPGYRRHKIATRLINTLVKQCRSKGPETIRVMVNERDSELGKFFASMEFKRGQYIDYTMKLKR
ncbi:GNAT family N-acetyltransferase [Chloroflexota bacterium]